MATKKKTPSKPKAKPPLGSYHKAGEAYVCRIDRDTVVRFKVKKILASSTESHEEAEVFETSKGAIVFFEHENFAYYVYKSIDELFRGLRLERSRDQELFAQLGGNLERFLPEI